MNAVDRCFWNVAKLDYLKTGVRSGNDVCFHTQNSDLANFEVISTVYLRILSFCVVTLHQWVIGFQFCETT